MCKKLNELDGKKPEYFLGLLGDKVTAPVDIEKILRKLGIEYFNYDFSAAEKQLTKPDRILGAALVDGDDVVILCSDEATPNRRRFTLAHELAHCCLDAQHLKDGHVEFRSDRNSKDPSEFNVNVFAGELLIPKKLLEEEYHNMIAPLSDVLAKIFEVSVNVMEKRLDYLKMPYYSAVVPGKG